ncbi:MFS transporter superfamily [Sesbania bispinosa]|nr:MFS transporter superfamily [Sesbania bispinosa]
MRHRLAAVTGRFFGGRKLTRARRLLRRRLSTSSSPSNCRSSLAVPVFLSEIAPSRIRGALNILFQLDITLGILFANIVNYATNKIKGGWGWRLSLGMGGIPALLLTLGAFLVVDTPTSLIERGRMEEGKAVLRKIRGTDNIEPEFLELVEASRVAKQIAIDKVSQLVFIQFLTVIEHDSVFHI